MSKLYVKLYGEFKLSGQDFITQTNNDVRRTVFSPDNKHSVSMVRLRDGTFLFTNEAMVAFNLTISRGWRVLAVLKYLPKTSQVSINNNWRIQGDMVENFAIHENPDLHMSPHVNFYLPAQQNIDRVDIKIDDGSFACLVFAEKDLLFVRMNGNHAHPRLMDVIQDEVQKATSFENISSVIEENGDMKKKIWKTLFQNWFFNGFFSSS